MRNLMGAAIAVLAITALAGCSTGPDASKIDAYRTVVHAMPAYADLSNDNLDKAAEGICRLFKADQDTAYNMAVSVSSENASQAEAHVLVKAAVAAYCPEFVKDIPAS